jgi:NIMA (never in mitosis gene a)-related kinase
VVLGCLPLQVVDNEYEGDEDEGEVEMEPGEEEGNTSGGWQPDPTRVQHMRSAMMIQRAACLDLIGEKAFNDL